MDECINLDAKPRLYKDVAFRSTLEAKWANFFDKLGWEWKYEPYKIENDDISWIPDFVITGYNNKPILCEVKPSDRAEDKFEIDRYAEATGNREEFILLGNNPLKHGDSFSGAALGWVFQTLTRRTEVAMFFNGDPIGFCDEDSSWCCRITGDHFSQLKPVDWRKIESLWFDASSEASTFPECGAPDHPRQTINLLQN